MSTEGPYPPPAGLPQDLPPPGSAHPQDTPPPYAAAPPPRPVSPSTPGWSPEAAPPPGPGSPPPPGSVAAAPPGHLPPPVWGTTPRPLTAHRPGIIALRPLLVGDILDGAVKAVRHNPKVMVGLAAIVNALVLIPSVPLALLADDLVWRHTPDLGADELGAFYTLPGTVVEGLFAQLGTLVLTGLLMRAVADAVLGRHPDIADVWRTGRGRLPALIGVNLLLSLAMLAVVVVLVAPAIVVLATSDRTGPGLLLAALGGLLAVVGTVVIWIRTSLTGPSVVLEKQSMVSAVRRSVALTRGSFWRLLGILLLAGVIAYVVGLLLSLPFSVANALLAGSGGAGSHALVSTVLSHLAQLLTGAITTPFVAAVTCLLYIDRRMRLEALDVALVRTAAAESAHQS